MLATRISFMNQLSHLCEKTGADIKAVAKGLGLDKRIGSRFLQAGVGYGGSCFPKDVRALISTLRQYECDADLFEAVHRINESQVSAFLSKIDSVVDVDGSRIAVWGISFKPKTDDIREAPAITIIKQLQKKGPSFGLATRRRQRMPDGNSTMWKFSRTPTKRSVTVMNWWWLPNGMSSETWICAR